MIDSKTRLPIDLKTRPLVLIFILMALGLISASYIGVNKSLINATKILVILLNLIGLYSYRRRLKWRRSIIYILIFLLSFIYLQQLELGWENEELGKVIGEEVSLRAKVVDVEVNDRGIEYLIEDIMVGDLMSKRRVLVSNWDGEKELSYGDIVEIDTQLRLAPTKTNPGSFSYRDYLKGENIYARANISRDRGLRVLANEGGIISKSIRELRRRMEISIDDYFLSPYSDILKALLLGRGNLPQDINDNFRELGLSHILVISGFHMGLISYFIALICKWLKLSKALTLLITISTLFFYLGLTGFGLSSVRAVILITLILIANYLGRRIDLYNILAGAGIIILLIAPYSLFKVSFQLSFIAVLSIAYLSPVIEKVLPIKKGKVKKILVATTAAQLGLLPVLAYYFYEVSFLGIVANPIIMPLVSVLIWLALPFLILATISFPFLAGILAFLMRGILVFVLELVNLLASNFSLSLLIGRPNILLIILYYLIIYYISKLLRPVVIPYAKDYSRYNKVLIASVILFLIVQFGFTFNRDLKLVFFDVGNGDAIYFETPNGRRGLIDAGVYGREVVSYLRSRGVRSLDFVFISHFHLDHAGGIVEVLDEFEVDKLFYPPTLIANQLEDTVLELALDREVSIYELIGGDKLKVDPIKINVLGPTYPLIQDSAANNNSLVFRFNYGDFKVLFTGDLELEGERRVLKEYEDYDLASTLLKVGHHGSVTSTSEKFLSSVGPKLAVIQVGDNTYGHPSPLVISNLKASGAKVLRNDQDGAITVFSDGRSYRYKTFK
ncbi:DNA internalization-related competence protein ComEC/Rec2 [Halonatronum saccharophilum]|uniref:DNA internalization-related competence protein ComEC/Rec2 n=1 Tax=Halonatronum saccharophilum TaxID=150060 RepID=UPI000485DC4B|nr:DNA internalization-related competence protein ComEC/Rec2 [Halonatronum saccharophilum]